MGVRTQIGDGAAQTAPASGQPPPKALIHHSGWFDGVRGTLGGLADKGKQIMHSDAVQHAADQAKATGEQILHSKRTGDLVQSVKASGTALYAEDRGHALSAVDAAKKGNYARAAQEALPLGEQAAMGPTKIAARVGTAAVASQLPPEQRKVVEGASHGLPHVTLTGMAKDAVLHQAVGDKPRTAGTTQTADVTGQAAGWIKKYSGQLFSGKAADAQKE
jgi:hypothetical protein